MGTECSNLINHISSETNSRNKLLDLITNSQIKKQKHNQEADLDFNLDLKLDFVRKIQKQYIKQNSKDIISYEKYPENRFIVKFTDNSHYRGYIDDKGKRQKQGQQTWSDGTKYIGYWKENLPHGNGILISPDGYTFEGNWNQGVVQGFGKYFGKLGSFQGDWKHNQPHGQGIQTWSDGSKYQGNYKNGKKQGKGKYLWPDKSSYSGDWYDGKISGVGTYHYIDGRVYQGSFKDNKMHGHGTYTWPDGRKYIGQYENDKKQGKGKYIWSDGRYFEGEWRDGKRNGYGKIVYPNRVIKYGIWEDDQKLQESVEINQYLKSRGESTQERSEEDRQRMRSSPSFLDKSKINRKNSDQKNHSNNELQLQRSLTLPKTQSRPLYASSISPYKGLKQYYEQYTGERGNMKERVADRYKFINSPLRKFNQMQLSGGGSYLGMMQQKRKLQGEGSTFRNCYKSRINRGTYQMNHSVRGDKVRSRHKRRDSSFV